MTIGPQLSADAVYSAERTVSTPAYLQPIDQNQGLVLAMVDHMQKTEVFMDLRALYRPDQRLAYVTFEFSTDERLKYHSAFGKEQHLRLLQSCTLGVLVHEFAHLCSPADEGHGRIFLANNLTLTREWLGMQTFYQLLRGYRAHNLPV